MAAETVLITGSNAGRVEGRVVEKVNKNSLLAKAYTGGNQRAQVHALADDICRAITLFDHLFTSRTIEARDSDSKRSTGFAFAGAGAARTLPESLPPVSLHIQRKRASK